MASYGRPEAARYNFMEDVEDISRYCVGGFHPVSIGDTMKEGRYRIVHKLGFGGYSTIWLALDTMHRQHVAVKVCAAHTRDGSLEEKILEHLSRSMHDDGARPGQYLVQTIMDSFDVQGPNGHHRCLVMPPAMMSIRDAKDFSYSRLFRPETARAIVVQLVLALDYVHSKGIVHAGEFHSS
jgi:serine/threonine protein kinase